MVLYSTPFHLLEHYPVHNVLVSQWYGPCTSQEYRESLNQFLHAIETLQVPYAIADRRLLPGVPADDARWTLGEFTDRFFRMPLRRFALLNAFDPLAEEQTRLFLEKEKEMFPFEIALFDDLTSAYDWLITGKKS